MKIQAGRIPFGYRAGKTIIHSMPAGLKLLCVIVISAAAFTSVYGLALSILLVVLASTLARLSPLKLLNGSKPLLLFSICIIIIMTIQPGAQGIFTPEIIIFNFYITDLYIPHISPSGFLNALIVIIKIFTVFSDRKSVV
jgi:energy-coupling factor transporter transmembrane protein EcfT